MYALSGIIYGFLLIIIGGLGKDKKPNPPKFIWFRFMLFELGNYFSWFKAGWKLYANLLNCGASVGDLFLLILFIIIYAGFYSSFSLKSFRANKGLKLFFSSKFFICFQSSFSMNLYGYPCFSYVLDSLNMFGSIFFWLNFYFVLIKGNLFSFLLLFLSSNYFKIKSISSSLLEFPKPERFERLLMILFLSKFLKGLGYRASCLLVCLNFSFVALKTSIFLSYFAVSSFGPLACYSNKTYLPLF